MIRCFLLTLALTGPFVLSADTDSGDVSSGKSGSVDGRFGQLVADYESFSQAHNPIRAGRRGDLEAAARWPDPSAEAVAERRRVQQRLFERVEEIDPEQLTEANRSSYAVMHYLLRSAVESAPFEPERMSFVNDSGFFSMPLSVAGSTRLATLEQADAWLQRLQALPEFLAGHRAWLERGIETDFVQPAYVVHAVIEQLEAIVATPSANSVLLAPLNGLPATLDQAHGDRLRARAVELIEARVDPAYAELLAFFTERYLAEPRESVGISAVPGGREYYRVLVRQHTTLDTTPEAVHQRGLDEVDRIRTEMQAVIAESGFQGSFAEFLDFLRTDKQFYANTEQQLLQHAAWIAKRADDQMPRFFGKLPRLSYGVRPVPEHMAPNYTTGRYWPGDMQNGLAGGYMVNTHLLHQRPLYSLPALTLHEAVPGHHHQGALAGELENVPDFRRDTYITAFGEGWALYTEHLGIEMGIYTTPYEHFGRLSYEMWRACRLVVDTGIHYFDWTRKQAEACLLENSALAPHNVRTEVARYISWPGQALAYKTGELLIRDLRRRAEDKLAEDFDLRAFHDQLLSDGAMPLSALEKKMTAWIEAGGPP
ncbi:MAG: DUF885 family protein [Wenzhouxiangellaceae bacterium]